MLKLLFTKMLIFFGIICSISAQGQSATPCSINVDSLFQIHFLSLDTIVKCNSGKVFIPNKDRQFVLLIGFLSGINVEIHSYSGQPILEYKEIINFKQWFNQNRKKIKCQSVIEGLLLLQKDLTDQSLDELEKLKIN